MKRPCLSCGLVGDYWAERSPRCTGCHRCPYCARVWDCDHASTPEEDRMVARLVATGFPVSW